MVCNLTGNNGQRGLYLVAMANYYWLRSGDNDSHTRFDAHNKCRQSYPEQVSRRVKMYGISVGIDPQQSTADSKRYEAGSLSWLKPLTSHFYLTGIFLFAIAFDVIAFTYLASLQLNN